jgi:hypothetical protein
MAALIRHGAEPPLDPVSLAKLADEIDEEEYYSSHVETTTGLITCRNCGALFHPGDHETTCDKCSSPWREVFRLCEECKKAFPSSIRSCEACGRKLERDKMLWTRFLGRALGMAVRRLAGDPRLTWPEDSYVGKHVRQLPLEQLSAVALEVEIFVMYESSVVLRKVVRSQEFNKKVVRAMLALYQQGWMLAQLRHGEAVFKLFSPSATH